MHRDNGQAGVAAEPEGLELDRGQVPEGRMNPLVHVDVIEEMTELAEGIVVVI